jgi:hypothetical protein
MAPGRMHTVWTPETVAWLWPGFCLIIPGRSVVARDINNFIYYGVKMHVKYINVARTSINESTIVK